MIINYANETQLLSSCSVPTSPHQPTFHYSKTTFPKNLRDHYKLEHKQFAFPSLFEQNNNFVLHTQNLFTRHCYITLCPMAYLFCAPCGNALFPFVMVFLFLISTPSMVAIAGNLYQDVDVTWGDGRGKILNNGQLLTLSLDSASGSGFQSKNQYLYGKIDMQIKLVPGNSAGTVTAYYVSNPLI